MDSEWSMTNVPDFAIVEVVSRLPLKYVVRAKSVCKRWLHLITSSNKLVRHLHDFDHRRLPRKTNPFILFWFAKGRDKSTFVAFHGIDIVTGNLHSQSKYKLPHDYTSHSWIAYSCNGLVCFTNSLVNHIYLCNPTTHQTIEIPRSAAFDHPGIIGLGFLPSSNQYILVRWFFPSDDSCSHVPGCEILSLTENKTPSCSSWRSVAANRHRFVRFSHELQPINIGTKIYWLVVESSMAFVILSYDLEGEESKLISLPVTVKLPAKARHMYLVELRGSLCLGLFTSEEDTEIWSLEDTANQKWIQKYKINSEILFRVVTSYHTDDHVEELVCAPSSLFDGLSYYNTKNNTIRTSGKMLGITHNRHACLVYDNSFSLSAETII